MKIKFLKPVAYKVVSGDEGEDSYRRFNANQVIEISNVIDISRGFVNFSLPNGDFLVDVKKGGFQVVS